MHSRFTPSSSIGEFQGGFAGEFGMVFVRKRGAKNDAQGLAGAIIEIAAFLHEKIGSPAEKEIRRGDESAPSKACSINSS